MGKLGLKKRLSNMPTVETTIWWQTEVLSQSFNFEAYAGAGEQKAESICVFLCICLWNFQSSVFWLFFFIYPSPLAFQVHFSRQIFALLSLTSNWELQELWQRKWLIYFLFSACFSSILWGNVSQASWAQPAFFRDPCLLHRHSPTQRGSIPLLKRAPCQTKCWAQRAMPALALFTQILIGSPPWEWTSKNGFSRSLWITFYSSGFPTVLVREKARETCSGVKMWGISHRIPHSPCLT